MSESKPGKASGGDSSSKNENKSGKGSSGDGSSRNENKPSKCSSAESSRDDGGRSASRKYDDRGRGRYEDERPYPGRVKSNYDEDRRYKGKGGYDDERPRSSRGKSDHYDDRSRSNRGKDDDRSYSAKSRSGYEDDRYYDRGSSSQSKSGRGEFKRGGNSDSQKGINKSRSENYSGYSDKGNSRKSSDRDVRSGDKGSIKNDKGTPKVDKASYNSTKNSKGASGDTKDRKNKMSDKTEKKDKDVKSSGKTAEFKSAADLEAQWQKEEEEKQKKEAEEQKRQEEIKRKEEEEKRKAEEEAKRLLEEEKKSIEDFIQESKDRNELKQKQREENLHAIENKPDESFYRKLDSSLKKNTAFVKKLKNLTESQKDSITKDFNGLNLTKYIGEVAAAITEAKLKMSDIPCAIHICCIMHQRYPEFYQALLENWQKCLLSKKDEKINNPSKYRVDLRFFADLIAVGVFPLKEAVGVLAGQLSLLMNNDKEEHNNLTIITSFCKHCGDDYVGLVPRRYRLLAEKYELDIPQSQFLPPDKHKGCRSLLSDYYQSLCKHLIKDHEEVKKLEHQNRRQLQTKGELSTERKEVFEKVWTAFQKLHENTSVFADLLDQDMPDLPEDNYKKDEEAGFDIFNPEKNAEFQYVGDSTLFEDEDARTFYETLPDLKAFIPGICYKDSEQAAGKDETKEEINELEEDIENLQIEDVEREMETEQQIAEVENTEAENVQDAENLHNDGEEMRELDLELEEDETDSGSLMKIQLEAYLQSLPNCVNRELIDKAGIEFCMNFNTKINRKKLVRALFTVHRTRYDLLPFYSRMVATLFPCMPDVANDLVQLLKSDFRWHVRKKDQINIESKLKTVRFIGELVKFKLFPKSEALHCLKMLMFDFSHHNIEMACTLLDTCGRFLYRSQDSHHRTKIYLDIMMRKKSSLHLENRYTTMIENAFYYSNPPETSQIARKVRPPLHEYVRKLLYKDLSKSTTERVLRQMRKLDWDDPEIAFYATKSLIAIWNIRYNSIHCAANLLAGLAPYHEHVAVQVVDGVLEDTRLGMEINHPKYNQRRVSCIKYLGELYNYRMVESAVIFKTLYSFITFGVSLDESNPSPLDVPEHLFRIRLTCVLLETCGTYFDKGSSKKKLDCFIVYFQRYYWFKRKHPIWCETRPFPIDVENLVHDTMELIRPKTKLFTNFEDAQKAVEDIENEYKDKVAAVLPLIDPDQDGSASENEEGLSTIQESDENCASEGELSGYEIDESQDSTEEASQSQKSRDGEESEGERVDPEEEEWMELAGELDEEDEITVLTGGPKHVKCSEDEDFMAAFDKMMNENIQARTNESLKVPQLDIAVPMHLKDKTKKAAANVSLYSTEEDETPVPKQKNAIEFVLMTRRGNKQQFTNLNVPISAEFAAKYKEREQAEKAEKERMKQVVLGIHERQEEEDYQERIAALNKQMPVNTNRERRVRYQHPKGAPDADLIFGSSKR